MFSVHTAREQSTVILDLCLKNDRSGNHVISMTSLFSKSKVFCPHKDAKLAFLTFSGLKNVSVGHRFRDGLVCMWSIGLTLQSKLR